LRMKLFLKTKVFVHFREYNNNIRFSCEFENRYFRSLLYTG
jgi:hypothetical protein